MEFSSIVRDFEQRFGIGIRVSDEGAFALEIDGATFVVRSVEDGRRVSLAARIGLPPPERLEELYAALLKANHLFLATGGATLSLDPETDEVTLCQSFDTRAMTPEEFHAEFAGFVETHGAWRTVVSEFRAREPVADDEKRDLPAYEGQSGGNLFCFRA